MARTLTPQDAHAIMNLLVKEATGQNASITAVDTSSFVSAGETVLATGVENTLNVLSIVIGKTLMAVRPYEAKFKIINALNSGLYNARIRKISFYAKDAESSGDWNTQLYTNLANGYDNGTNGTSSTHSMWQQNQAVPLEMNFAGQSVWEDSITIYEDQLKVAFTNEGNFNSFVAGIMTEKGNDIESQKEEFNRLAMLNHIAGVYDLKASMSGSVINLTKAFNDKYGTSYTSAQLRTTYYTDFLKFMTAEIKKASIKMTNRSKLFHWSPAKTIGSTSYSLLRHTPKADQRLVLLSDMIIDAEAQVMPEIFNPQYLDFAKQAEVVEYWQNINEPSKISVTPSIPNTSTGVQTTGSAVALDYVVGCLFDKDALMIDYQLERSASTPLEARKNYRNIWWSFSKNAISDFTENFIVFTMEDPAS